MRPGSVPCRRDAARRKKGGCVLVKLFLKHSAALPVSLLVSLCFFATFFAQTTKAQTDQRGLTLRKTEAGESRIALVIGNSVYSNAPLQNPVNDARDTAKALVELGFEVTHGENLSQNDMKRVIRVFGDKIRNGGVGLFYYAGHGVQVNGINYLIPVGATITKEEEVEYESVDVGFVLAQMENARNRLNIVILDACRNNPFARSFRSTKNGLASIDAPSGTLIAYATAPGSVASDGNTRNGLYTQELLNAIRIPGLKIEDVFKQVRRAVQSKSANQQLPWESSSLVGDFYFGEAGVARETPARPGQTESSAEAPKKMVQQPRISESDYEEVQKIYQQIKGETDCDKTRRLAERLTSYYSNTNLVPEDKRVTLRYPSGGQEPTIANLARDRYLRIRSAKNNCFAK